MNFETQLTPAEENMMREIFEVMNKYSKATRAFGVNLVHSHFQLKKGEILYETHNKEKRILITNAVIKKTIKKRAAATAWEFSKKGKIKVAMFCCDVPDVPSGGETEPAVDY
jgi:hypothetical protein